jgi:hypothetical protein
MKKQTAKDIEALRKRRGKRRAKFLDQVMLDTKLTTSEKLVIWCLAQGFYNTETERCDPGPAKISEKLGGCISWRQVQRALKGARIKGWVAWPPNKGGAQKETNDYTFPWGKLAATTLKGEEKVDSHTPQQNPAEGGGSQMDKILKSLKKMNLRGTIHVTPQAT